MSKLSDRCEERKVEAQALADKFNALTEESKKIENEKAQVLEQQILETQAAPELTQPSNTEASTLQEATAPSE